MALTQVGDVIVPDIFTDYLQLESALNSRFLGSGIVATDALLNNLIRGGGATFDVPFWNAIPQGDSTPGGDTTTAITAQKVTAGKQIGVRLERNAAWQAADIVSILAGDDPLGVISRQGGRYWGLDQDKVLIAVAKGILAAEAASRNPETSATEVIWQEGTAGDALGTAPSATDLFSENTIPNAFAATVGDASDAFDTIAMHSIVYHSLTKQNLITFRPFGEQNIELPTFLGKRVIFTDAMPTAADNARTLYTSVMFRSGAIGYGEAPMTMPLEIEREALQGNGAGISTIVSRRQFMFHPGGYRWDSPANAANQSTPNNTILQTSTSWTRVVETKLASMIFIQTNG
ncbi:major capsid protein [Engelhardtia mirabilis]|uniref:Major capsid protein n=1 Tax=Engelhardtia mirabilis TaxID=2528011 RepID=A0A518BL51_9BACT|nr:hypothetical protein Pla133_27900 [Planctomycetes bacterium Pla133]QDV02028.1 hypothetical protein Pla86_27890 [Planctomycetes bacterium Pla86]